MRIFDWFKQRAETRRVENEVRQAGAKVIAEALTEIMSDESDEWQKVVERKMGEVNLREDTSNVVTTRSEGGAWEILGSAYKGHVARDQQIMIAQARRFFRFDPNGQAAIYGLVDYLMGRGLTITPKSKDPRIWKLWRNFWTSPDNQMGIRQFDMMKRVIRDGEFFLRFFTKSANGSLTPFTKIRFMDPIDVRRGPVEGAAETDKMSQGITYDPNDAEKPLKYYMAQRNNPAQYDEIDASDVLHVKFPVADMDQPRGESAIQAVMSLMTDYKQWLKNRIILNKLRTAIFAVRKIDAQSGTSVNQLNQSLPTSARSGSGETRKVNIRPGTMYTPPPGVSIEMQSPNIQASDVKEDGRNIVLQMAAGTRLPEFMFGDASNANYSSTMMAESPFVKHIHFLQSYFEETLWKPLFRRVVKAAVDAGKLDEPVAEDIFADPKDLTEDANETPEETQTKSDLKSAEPKGDADAPLTESELEIFYGCDVQWPEIIHRDPKEQTDALVEARANGWVSDKTCSEMLGFDYAEEVRKQRMLEEEAERIGNPLMNHAPGADAADQEEQDGLDQIDKEEKLALAGNQNGANANNLNGKTGQ